MVIEVSGVQFGLKSYPWFQNRTSAQREFDLKSQVWFQTKIARPEVQWPLYQIHFEIAQFNSTQLVLIDLIDQILRALSSLRNSALLINLSGRSLETKDASI